MTNPFGLEVLLNSRVLPVELPALAAHEYAHLAGFADEADASVVAWLACQGGTPALRYSGALAVLPHLLTGLPRETQRSVIEGPGGGTARGSAAIAPACRNSGRGYTPSPGRPTTGSCGPTG